MGEAQLCGSTYKANKPIQMARTSHCRHSFQNPAQTHFSNLPS